MRNSSPPFDVLLCLLVWPHAGLNSLEGLCALRSPVTACGIAAPRTDCDGALPDDSLRCSNCFACDETKPAWVRNGDEPMRVSPLHSMLVRMPRGTTGDAFRAAMRERRNQCAQPAGTSTRVFRSQTSLCRLTSALASESALCEPLHGRVCMRSSMYSIVIVSVRCTRQAVRTACLHGGYST